MKIYFAELAPSDLGRALVERRDKFYASMENSGQTDVIIACIQAYYGLGFNSSNGTSHRVERAGKYGQTKRVRVNHIRNLGLHILQLSTSQRPSPVPVAINTDSKSQESCQVTRGVLDYYGRFKRVDRLLRAAAEKAVVTGGGYVMSGWHSGVGEMLAQDVDSGMSARSGDLSFHTLTALEVIKEVGPGDSGAWRMAVVPANRYDLLAQYAPGDNQEPSYVAIREALEKASPLGLDSGSRRRRPYHALLTSSSDVSEDRIAMFEFQHAKTPACPDGKLARMTEEGFVFYSGPLPTPDITIRELSPGEIMDTPFGYGPLFDLLGVSEVIDALYSAVASNQMTFATQLIFAVKDADFDYRQLTHGISLLEGNDQNSAPVPLALTKTPAEVFEFIKQLESILETLSGVNATVRGNPEYSLKSGSALALVQSQAIQFASTLQHQYAQLVEDVYSDMLSILSNHVDDPRQIVVIGKFNRPYTRSFSKNDLKGVSRVIVEAGPTVAQTTAWKQEVARDMASSGLLKRPEEYLAVAMNGKLEAAIETDNAELMLIQGENELLKEGKSVEALPTDEHVQHIKEHRAVAADPEARNDPALVKVLADHVSQHVTFLSDPALATLLMVLGQTPLAAANIPEETMAGGSPEGAPTNGLPQAGEAPQTQPQNEMPEQPSMPTMPQGPQEQ